LYSVILIINMSYPLKIVILDKVLYFIEELNTDDNFRFSTSVTAIRYGNYESITIKTLKGNIKELIIKRFRFVFFIDKEIIYFIGAFIKKTNKTPKLEIENALKNYKIITNSK